MSPDINIADATVIVIAKMPVEPSESVAVTVSLYVAGVTEELTVIRPEVESIEIPEIVGTKLKDLVPVPLVAVNAGD